MRGYWIDFTDYSAGYVEAVDEDAAIAVAEKKTAKSVSHARRLPYPAEPIIHQESGCPAFCCTPRKCAGNTACPQRPSCSE